MNEITLFSLEKKSSTLAVSGSWLFKNLADLHLDLDLYPYLNPGNIGIHIHCSTIHRPGQDQRCRSIVGLMETFLEAYLTIWFDLGTFDKYLEL